MDYVPRPPMRRFFVHTLSGVMVPTLEVIEHSPLAVSGVFFTTDIQDDPIPVVASKHCVFCNIEVPRDYYGSCRGCGAQEYR